MRGAGTRGIFRAGPAVRKVQERVRPSPRLGNGTNQLEDLFAQGKFNGVKPANWDLSPKWWGIRDSAPGVTVERKARAYIAANCSGCHGTRGISVGASFGLDLNLDYHTGTSAMALENKPTSWPYNLDTLAPLNIEPALVVPGHPGKSVILYRQKTRNSLESNDVAAFDPHRNQMPPLATFEVDEEAMKVIERWIREISQTVTIPREAGKDLERPGQLSIHGRFLLLPAEMAALDPAVSMVGINGRIQTLTRTGKGVYNIPSHLPAGIYVLRVGRESFTRYLF